MVKYPEFNQLLNPELQHFIKEHENDDENTLVLKYKEIHGVPVAVVARQIVGRRKAKTKLSLLYNTPGIIYPLTLNLEQCSSELTANFKSNFITGEKALDLTGGFGIDSFFLSKKFKKVIYVEKDEKLLQLAKHNHEVLGTDNIEHICMEAESFVQSTNSTFDLVYIDPSRRSISNKKVFKFDECSPNVISLLPTLLEKSKSILIKASPLIDIKQGIRELGNVSKVFVIGYSNECKEVLFLVSNDNKEALMECVDLSQNKISSFSFTFTEESQAEVSYSAPLQYLYEPSAMILKGGAFKLVGQRSGLKKLAPNTHLYTSKEFVKSFPGKIFKIENHLKSNAKSVYEVVPNGMANMVTRNYPLTPAQLKKKLKLKDGGDDFVIGTSGEYKKYLIHASRIK